MWIYEPQLKHFKILTFLIGQRKRDKKKKKNATCAYIQFQSVIKQNQDSYPEAKARFVKEEEWANPDKVPSQYE